MNHHLKVNSMRGIVSACAVSFALAASAYLPPVDERCGVEVEIGSFPQKIERPGKNPYAWPLGVTEVQAGTPRPFTVTLKNKTDKPVTGELEVWMNDDWDVAGPQGTITLTPGGKMELSYTGTSRPSALNALYPVNARFTPTGAKREDAPHPIAIFMFKNPNAARPVRKTAQPRLASGAFSLEAGFARTTSIEVKGKIMPVDENGSAAEWGAHMSKERPSAGGVSKSGFSTHPPFKKGAGFIWSDFPLDLPSVTPITFSCSNFLVDHYDAPPSDGAEYKVFVMEEGRAPQLICSQIVKDILTWRDMSGDLSPWAGKKITLRLWTGPGPKMNTCCDGGGWGDVKLLIGPQPKVPDESDWTARSATALAAAQAARVDGTDAAIGRWRLDAGDVVYGAGVAYGERGLIDGALAFTDGKKSVVFRGFTARTETDDGSPAPEAKASIREEKDTLRISWSIPGVTRNAAGFPRIVDLAVGPASETPHRVFMGFGNVVEGPKKFTMGASGFGLSTRHVGADYANGLSVVQAVDVVQDSVTCDGERNLFSLHAHHDATFTFVPSSKGSFEAGRRFRAVSGYKASPGRTALGSRMCLDQWGGDYAQAATDLAKAAKYGLNDSIFVKHVWQRWGYDYRLPEIFPPAGDTAAFGAMRKACCDAGILFCPHDNYTDIYPDCNGYTYDLTVFNLDGTPQLAWFNPGRHARSYRWAPHAFHPWCLRNAKLLKEGYDPDAIFIDVFTAHCPFDYLDRQGNFHSKNETSACWGRGFQLYREGFRRPDTVCVSEAGQDHLVGVADAGQSDHFGAPKLLGRTNFADSERTPWHDIATHGYYVLFAGGLGGRYQEEDGWHTGGDAELHGYASDDYLSNGIIGGRNPMCNGPFSRNTVKTYWLQHDACAELGHSEFLDLKYENNIHCQHAFFSDGGEVWVNRQTNMTWRLPNGVALPPYGYYARTRGTESGVVEKDGVRYAFAKSANKLFVDARKPSTNNAHGANSRPLRAEVVAPNRLRLFVSWETKRPLPDYRPFVHICTPDGPQEGIVFQCGMARANEIFAKAGAHETFIDVAVPPNTLAGTYEVRYGAWRPNGGHRLAIGGAPSDGGHRIKGGRIVVTRMNDKISSVGWVPEDSSDEAEARDRLLGVNRAGRAVQFDGVKTDGSFRFADWTIMPLPYSDAFSAEIDLAAFGASGRTVVGVDAVEPEDDAIAPSWNQLGNLLKVSCDAKSFAYRIRLQ